MLKNIWPLFIGTYAVTLAVMIIGIALYGYFKGFKC